MAPPNWTAPWVGRRKDYCRYERKYSQTHLGESELPWLPLREKTVARPGLSLRKQEQREWEGSFLVIRKRGVAGCSGGRGWALSWNSQR